jgi:hypothetical protein
MTSGERQYRNGCEQGYIAEHCEQFSVEHLLATASTRSSNQRASVVDARPSLIGI